MIWYFWGIRCLHIGCEYFGKFTGCAWNGVGWQNKISTSNKNQTLICTQKKKSNINSCYIIEVHCTIIWRNTKLLLNDSVKLFYNI
jgi:hypothetical protein